MFGFSHAGTPKSILQAFNFSLLFRFGGTGKGGK
jgi:hypothetical protein